MLHRLFVAGLLIGSATATMAQDVPQPQAPANVQKPSTTPQTRNEAQGIMAPRVTGPQADQNRFHFFGSFKSRFEDTNYFSSNKANGDYAFSGSILRFGVRRETSKEDMLVELAVPILINLPTHASAPSPQGTLGQGASYFASNGSQVAALFPKQLYERFKHIGGGATSLQIGRFEFVDGAESRATDESLAYLKQNRVANRLISPNPFSYIGRSFDGAEFINQTADHTLVGLAAMPTRGGYDLSGSDELSKIRIAYLGATQPHGIKGAARVSDTRLFAILYEDARDGQTVKVDNRTAVARQKDKSAIDLVTFGGHDIRIFPAGSGRIDTLFWTAAQVGKWGTLNHGAYAFDAELGYQPRDSHLRPWYRLGYYYGSGDGNGANNQHGTFFPMMPSGRTYARFPFFSTSNLEDAFAEVILRPTHKVLTRTDVRKLGLASSHDLYYTGSGAYDNSNFGFTGRSSSGSRDLATLVDTSIDYQIDVTTLLIGYVGYGHGGKVLSSIYNSRDAAFAYIELQKRF